MTTSTAVKKDTTKLQRAIVDGLEDVKAQDIKVFDTEALSPLFERVIVASGTSNRQTKALAASVRDAVREAGFAKPRVEGEDNGEWIIVDCGRAVVHIMQPNIRQYYNLEELWGEKPVRMKIGAAKPAAPEGAKPAAKKAASKTTSKAAAEPTSLKRASAAKKGVAEAFPSKAALKKAAAKSAPAKKAAPARSPAAKASGAKKPSAKKITTVVVNKPVAKKAATKSAAAKPVAKKAPAKKPVARKA